MLQRLAQFCVALLEFLEQPHILDSDHGLGGKGFKKRDLFFRKRTDFRVDELRSLRSATLLAVKVRQEMFESRTLRRILAVRIFSLDFCRRS